MTPEEHELLTGCERGAMVHERTPEEAIAARLYARGWVRRTKIPGKRAHAWRLTDDGRRALAE